MAQQPAGSALQSILNAAVAAHQAGDVAAAVSGYRRVLAAMPKHAPTLHLMGVALTQSGDAEGGVRSIKSAIKLAPRDPVFHFNLANAERAAGRDSRALAALEAAIARKPDYAEAHLNRANLLERVGRVEEAERAYRAATQYAPDWPLPRINLTLLLARSGKVTAALELAASLPRNGPGLNASGVALRAAGRLDEAEAAFRAALSQNAADRDARGNLGAVLLEGGALDEAEPLLESAAADGGPVEARANLARLYFKRSRTRDALALLDAVIAERPTDPALLAQRAVLREMISDEAGAQADVDAGLALKPGHPELTYVAALLRLREGAAEAALNLLDS
ncbi:MAG: tetratricopeptide repeat protein, partial [Alphaproteobacteria bacterium]|nr:tetratricopeptide repeat protein [Alphaproteobacteria bacterium]